MARYLGIDYGLERTGLAVTDPEGRIAFPLRTLKLKNFRNRGTLLDEIAKQAALEKVDEIVIGLPLSLAGEETPVSRQVRNMAERLQRRCALPIHFVPEALSSEQALKDLREAGVKPGKIKDVLDQQAACVILDSFLEAGRGSQ